MKQFNDHSDEDGYRAYLASDDEATLIEFANWLDAHGIGWRLVRLEEEPELDTVWTDWITDRHKAVMLKLAWGGA